MDGIDADSSLASSPSSPGISVIIPTFNRKHFLKRAIDSVLEQAYPQIEIIVIDDGSTDGTDQALQSYGDKIRYFYRQNLGPSAARNFAAQHCQYPYIAFLDSDDYWLPHRLKTQMEVWQSLPDDYGIVANDISLFDEHNQHFHPKRLFPLATSDISTSQLLVRNRFAPSATIMKRSVFEQCRGFDESLMASEDRDLWIRASKHHKIHFIKDRLTMMRKHPANISKEADRMRSSILAMLKKSFQNRVVARIRVDIWLKALSFGFFVIACLGNYERRPMMAWSFLLLSCLVWPFHGKTREELNEPILFRTRMFCHFFTTLSHSFPRKQATGLAKSS